MSNFAKSKGVDVTLALGDNFYDRGVTSVDDSRFETTFENVFDKDVLTDFRVLAGNHDHNGGTYLRSIQALLLHTHTHSSYYYYYYYYYTHTHTLNYT